MKKIIFWFLVFLVWVPDGRAQAPYFEGKTIRIVVGYPAGSAHDQWGRLIAPYLTKFIPGNPNAIIQNMAGAGSMVAANYIYGVAKPDGLSLGISTRHSISTSCWPAKRSSSIGQSLPGLAARRRPTRCFTCGPVLLTRQFTMFARPPCRLSAAPLEPATRATTCPNCLKRPSAQNLTS